MSNRFSGSVLVLGSKFSLLKLLRSPQLKHLVFSLLVTALIFVSGFSPARAEEAATANKVAVLDVQKLLVESLAGKSLQEQLKERRDNLQGEASAIEKKLKGEEQTLIKERSSLSSEEFEKKKKKFEEDVLSSRKEILRKSNELDGARKEALGKLRSGIAKAAADIADEKKFQLVVDRQFVVLVEESLDVTDLVLAKLNDQVKSISLAKAKSK